jgi:hypothetical protein
MVTPSMVQVEAVNRTTWPLATTAVNPRMLSLARVERVSGWEREREGEEGKGVVYLARP